MFTDPVDVPRHDAARHGVLAGVAGMRDGLDLVDGSPGWSPSDEQARAALVEVTRLSARTRAVYLRLLAECARRDIPGTGQAAPDGVPDQGQRVETTAWLGEACRMSAGRVRSDLAEAHALDPDTGALRALGADLAAGQVTPEHASIAVRALARIPVKTRTQRREDIDARLAENARRFTPAVTTVLARHLLAAVDPGASGVSTSTPTSAGSCIWAPTPPGWWSSAASSNPPAAPTSRP